jgi:RNA polymerase sigma factor (sigma-70 family)
MERRPENITDAVWLELLRGRLVEIATRRVDESDVDDVVQDALRVIAEKRFAGESGSAEGRPDLAWCFQVLRNTIGNHYRREETRRRRLVSSSSESQSGSRFAETLGSSEALALIEDALEEMHRGDPRCARYLSRLIDSAKPHEVATEEGIEPPVFYRRLYRCRQKMRDLLTARGVDV